MRVFRDLSLAIKQGIGFGLVLVIMAWMSLFAIDQMQELRREVDEVNNSWLQRVVVISNLHLHAAALRSSQVQLVVTTDEAAARRLIDEEITGSIDGIIENLDRYEGLMADSVRSGMGMRGEAEVYARFDERWEQYQDLFIEIISLYESDEREAALALLNGEAAQVFEAFQKDLATLVSLNREGAAASAVRAEATFASTRAITLALLALTILTSVAIAVLLVRLVTGRVWQLRRAAERVAEGDLEVAIEIQGRDEIGSLAQSFNRMTMSLRQAMAKTQQQQAELRAQQEQLQAANEELTAQSHSLAAQKAEIERKHEALETALDRLRETQQQLILREKLASLGQLTAGIAHEIKNPLNFINNFAKLSLELYGELEEEMKAHPEAPARDVLARTNDLLRDLRMSAEKIADHGRRADGIVKGMLQHSRESSSEAARSDLNGFLDEYVNLAYHGMRATLPGFNVTIDRDYDPSVGTVRLVPQEMGRVLINLFNNAFYAVHERSQAEGNGFEPRVQVQTRRHNGSVELRVADNGPGVPEDLRSRIFEPFFTTKPTGEGTGLGLSLAYDIVTQGHNGTLAVESTPAHGATFVLTLPG